MMNINCDLVSAAAHFTKKALSPIFLQLAFTVLM